MMCLTSNDNYIFSIQCIKTISDDVTLVGTVLNGIVTRESFKAFVLLHVMTLIKDCRKCY